MEQNEIVLTLASKLLTSYSDKIKKSDIDAIVNEYIDEEMAYRLLIFSMCGLDMNNEIDKEFYHNYIEKMIWKLDKEEYEADDYFNLNLTNIKYKNVEFKWDTYKPYELFPFDDLKKDGDRIIPSLGFFTTMYKYPAIYKNKRIWMSVIPNEINTMRNDISLLSGNVVVCGLGMGYLLYHILKKKDVKKVIVVEYDKEIIEFFNNYLKDQFPNIDKVQIVEDDAINYLKHLPNDIDMVYIDLWHDASDGIPIYLKCKKIEPKYKNVNFRYWIEESINIYIDQFKNEIEE